MGGAALNFSRPKNPKILAFIREYEDEVMLVVANLSRYSQAAEIDLSDYAGYRPVEVFSHNKFPEITENEAVFTLGSHGYYWFLLEKEAEKENFEDRMQKPAFAVKSWDALEDSKIRGNMVNKLIKPSMLKARWFGGKARTVVDIEVLEQLSFVQDEQPFYWFVLEVSYNEGLPEMYQLPVTYCSAAEAEDTRSDFRKGFLGRIKLDDQEVVLFDAVYSQAFRTFLMEQMIGKGQKSLDKFSGSAAAVVKDFYKEEGNKLEGIKCRTKQHFLYFQ